MSSTPTQTTQTTPAILSSGPSPDDTSTYTPGSNWTHTTISVPTTLSAGDILIEMAASGICHTDLTITAPPLFTSPRIVGHEGAGYVHEIGPGVTKDLKVGDPVLLSFDHCGKCESCGDGHPAYCTTFMPLNIFCVPDVFYTNPSSGEKIGIAGKCFGQSSFAGLSVVKEACVLNAKDLVKSKDELMLFAPLGCGIQTGAGAVLNLAKPGKRDRVMVFGLGGVGLSAVAAAVISGCKQIVAVDLIQSRIDLARTFGATDGLNTSNVTDLEAAFKEACGGQGPTVVIDTTGHVPLLTAALASLGPRGTLIPIGASREADYGVKLDFTKHMLNGTRIIGCCEGDSLPEEFIPQLIQYYREGKLPLEKMAKFYKAADFKTAVHDMHTGETIKPILTW